MINGSNLSTRVAELESEIQQRDSLIQMKTDELRRIALQNHDYEVEVLFEWQDYYFQIESMKKQLEELRKDDKETLVQENKQLKEENTTIQKGSA